jgi:hypothetical protein
LVVAPGGKRPGFDPARLGARPARGYRRPPLGSVAIPVEGALGFPRSRAVTASPRRPWARQGWWVPGVCPMGEIPGFDPARPCPWSAGGGFPSGCQPIGGTPLRVIVASPRCGLWWLSWSSAGVDPFLLLNLFVLSGLLALGVWSRGIAATAASGWHLERVCRGLPDPGATLSW